jgi:hypothetical protein
MGLYSTNQTQPVFHMSFTIANARQLLSYGNVAYNNIASVADSSSSLTGTYALGLATFFGRTMYFVFRGKTSSLGTGPINAVSPQQ